MTRRPVEVQPTPKAHLANPATWPYGPIALDHVAARYMKRLANALIAAIGPEPYRDVARWADVPEDTIRAILSGDLWPDVITVAKLESALGYNLWPGLWLFMDEMRDLRARYQRSLARRGDTDPT